MTKQFDPAALASITTGTLMVDFLVMHEAIEHVAGRPIMTHQLASRELCDKLKAMVLAQFPEMPTDAPDDWKACRHEVTVKYGKFVTVKKGEWTFDDND